MTSQDPQLLQSVLTKDTSILPYSHDAFQYHLSRFPSTHNGLGIVEQTTLERVRAGIHSGYELFEHVGNRLNNLGMGDLEYWHILKEMSRDPYPLLQIRGLQEFPAYNRAGVSFGDCDVILTELGNDVLEGKEDWIAKKGIDKWYGGVHLQGNFPRWRWNSTLQSIEDTGISK